MSKPSTDVIRRVFEEGGKYFFEVGPWADSTDMVELRTTAGEYSEDYWGRISISMTPDMADQLGRALIASADDCRAIERDAA